MASDSESIQQIVKPRRLWTAVELLAVACPIPKQSGIYGMYFQTVPLNVPTSGCNRFCNATLLYVGISPEKPAAGKQASTHTLFDRIRFHLRGNAERSTFRFSVGCLVRDLISIQLCCSEKSRTWGSTGERALSEWIAANVLVCWAVHPSPWEVEEELLRRYCVPLNIKHNPTNVFRRDLKALRRQAKLAASR